MLVSDPYPLDATSAICTHSSDCGLPAMHPGDHLRDHKYLSCDNLANCTLCKYRERRIILLIARVEYLRDQHHREHNRRIQTVRGDTHPELFALEAIFNRS